MKAMMYHDYGSPDVLICEEVEIPIPSDNQVLIKVRAAAEWAPSLCRLRKHWAQRLQHLQYPERGDGPPDRCGPRG